MKISVDSGLVVDVSLRVMPDHEISRRGRKVEFFVCRPFETVASLDGYLVGVVVVVVDDVVTIIIIIIIVAVVVVVINRRRRVQFGPAQRTC